jgi:hypothetical protein
MLCIKKYGHSSLALRLDFEWNVYNILCHCDKSRPKCAYIKHGNVSFIASQFIQISFVA